MLEISLIFKGIKEFRDLVFRVKEHKLQERKRFQKVLRAIYTAALETRAYLADIRAGGQSDREHEQKLSRLWMEASVQLSHIDFDLADKCMIKASCWSDPKLWNDKRYANIPLDIDTIAEETKALLERKTR